VGQSRKGKRGGTDGYCCAAAITPERQGCRDFFIFTPVSEYCALTLWPAATCLAVGHLRSTIRGGSATPSAIECRGTRIALERASEDHGYLFDVRYRFRSYERGMDARFRRRDFVLSKTKVVSHERAKREVSEQIHAEWACH
jgi:hypothetical protein